jgi:HD-GYP domain-containing protein (c-di-GMP phosphodiesterase class II)
MDWNGYKHAPRLKSRHLRGAVPLRPGELWQDRLTPGGAAREEACEDTESILIALALAVEQRDRSTAWHCERLALISVHLGIAMRLDRLSLISLYRGGFLHDVGKVGIPDSILFKPGKLTAQEWVVMRSHTSRGEEICRHLKSLAPVLPIIRHHHERWDGSGYPDGLRGAQIPLIARVLQIADIYDALTSPRPYKDAFSPDKALQILRQEAEWGWRDPEITQLFLRIHGEIMARLTGLEGRKDHSAEIMQASLGNLQRHLSGELIVGGLSPRGALAPPVGAPV